MKKETVNRLLMIMAVFFPVSEIWKQVLLWRFNGYYDFWYFPFQLCSMPAYLLPLYFIIRNEKVRNTIASFLICYGLTGALAVFFDTSGMHYELTALTFHSFLWHILMIIMAVGLLQVTDLKEKHCIKASLLYLLLAAIATALNCTLHRYGSINMFYISPYQKMNQIVFRDLAEITGQKAIIIIYMLATIVAAEIIYQLCKALKQRSEQI